MAVKVPGAVPSAGATGGWVRHERPPQGCGLMVTAWTVVLTGLKSTRDNGL